MKQYASVAKSMSRHVARLVAQFGRAQDGAIIVLGLIIFVLMLMVSGLAVDVMRYENERTRLQGTTDRAVLAATSILNTNATMTPAELAQAYFDAEGLGQFAAGNIAVTESAEDGRRVRITPNAQMDTMFLRMSGVDDLVMSAPGAAWQRAGEDGSGPPRVEVVMVLDRSGSMGRTTSTGFSRLHEMKLAAKSFAETLFDETTPGNISLSLVSYNDWVLPAPGMLNHMLRVDGSGACMDFDDWGDVRDGIGPPATPGGGGPYGGNTEAPAGVGQNSRNAEGTRTNCWTNPAFEIKPMVDNLATFEGYVDALTSGGTTSIDLGARFGAMLLDPDMRGFIDSLVDSDDLPDSMSGRPFDWDEPNVHRVFVLLTDGQNCCGARFSTSVQDDNVLGVCDGLKANDVTVYTVSYEAPQGSVDLLSECATSPNYFYNSGGAGLSAAFDSIATHVISSQRLRLTE